jgi:hypothetical protein
MSKPIVRYIPPAQPVWFERAYLRPINHRNHVEGQAAVNGSYCTTSRVLSWDDAGRIETLHTVYLPLEESDAQDEMVVRVGKPEGVPA